MRWTLRDASDVRDAAKRLAKVIFRGDIVSHGRKKRDLVRLRCGAVNTIALLPQSYN